jgi:hypothetical protein
MPRQTQAPLLNGNKPIHSIRHRSIKAAIWKNQTAKGDMYSVTITRSYKEGEAWHDSHSFGFDDLLVVAKLMYDAHSYISALKVKDRPAAFRGAKRHGEPAS